jgi:hypothetical protein
MYKPIIRISELRNVLTRFRVVETALDSVIFFLSLFLILSYAGVYSLWALFLPPVLFFLIALKYRVETNITKLIEKRYPLLRERLSALYDNREEKNAVVDDLAVLVNSDLDRVKYSSFISTWRFGIRTAVILLLVALVLSSSFTYFPENSINPEDSREEKFPESIGTGSAQDIFEEPSVVKLGNESEGVLVYRSQGSEPNIRGEGKQVAGYSMLFPPEATSSEIFSEAVPIMYQQIVKNYFTNISSED